MDRNQSFHLGVYMCLYDAHLSLIVFYLFIHRTDFYNGIFVKRYLPFDIIH